MRLRPAANSEKGAGRAPSARGGERVGTLRQLRARKKVSTAEGDIEPHSARKKLVRKTSGVETKRRSHPIGSCGALRVHT